MPAFTFEQAAAFELPLGKFKGRRLDAVAETDDGLLYLDWLSGQDWVAGRLRDALSTYLTDASIRRDLDALLDDD